MPETYWNTWETPTPKQLQARLDELTAERDAAAAAVAALEAISMEQLAAMHAARLEEHRAQLKAAQGMVDVMTARCAAATDAKKG